MAIYPEFKLYIDTDGDGNPTDNHTPYAISDISGQYGIFTDKDTDRVASAGSISFTLDNRSGYYSDNDAFTVGTAITITVTVNGVEKKAFAGRVLAMNIETGTDGEKRIQVDAQDWMNLANNVKVKNLPVYSNLRADEAIPYLTALMSLPPEFTDFDEGTETFANVFDGALPRTVVYSELDKLTKSELGYLYLKHKENDYGVTLRFENRLNRGSTRELDKVPTSVITPTYLKYHGTGGTSGYLKYHGASSTSGKIRVAEATDASFDNLHIDALLTRGDNIINKFTCINVPRKTDTTVQVLYSLGTPIQIGASQKINLNSNFSDVNGGTVITAFDVVTPVATTDYLFNSASDGTGTDYTANIVFTFNYGVNGFNTTIKNNGPAGYLTMFNVRGKGIYKYNPVEIVTENEASINAFGEKEATMRREYSGDLNTSRYLANAVTGLNRFSLKNLKRVDFIANYNEFLMAAFMYLDVGSKVRIIEDFPAMDNEYYIQGIKFNLSLDGMLTYSWFLKRANESILTPIVVRGNIEHTLGLRNAIDFGILPHLRNMEYFSYSFWVNQFAVLVHTGYGMILARDIDTGSGRRGNFVQLVSGKLHFRSYKTPNDGHWNTTNVVLPTDNIWHHVVVTYDNTTDTANPTIYIDGTPVAVTETSTPSGASDSDSDCPLILFSDSRDPNVAGQEYYIENEYFKLKDVRIYNRILSQAEVTELANGEDDYTTVQDGLKFQGIFAPTDYLSDYVNDEILNTDLLVETVTMAVGIPYNEDTSSADYVLRGENI